MKSSASRQRRQQRLKCVVIPVLVAILAAVVFWPASDPAADTATQAATATQATKERPAASAAIPVRTVNTAAATAQSADSVSQTSNSVTAASTTPAVRRWPELPLHEITAVNPFVKKPAETTAQTQVESQSTDAPPATASPWLRLATDLAAWTRTRSAATADEPARPQDPPAGRPAFALPRAAQLGQATETMEPTEAEDSELATAIDYATIGRFSAIVHGVSGRQALLDGNRIVRAGDEVPGGFQIVQITDDEIWVRAVEP
ncbi:hypothetical protein [Roseimaritima ulvae]|uniref:Uncharacterized protein n=1 Tax=Roseimaritima ulvae TaxID=980254 RepID=A0A5B9R130_9BACT|nr:hypothetical protein [Roseimaritima ulvae]QEG43485.1 hypothetical protein UC8_55350 [Roseimaritima ulvae]